MLLTAALEGWAAGGSAGRRQAFKNARALLAALDLSPAENPAETAGAAARRARKKDDAATLAEILRELPEEKGGGVGVLRAAIRALLERGPNDGTVAVLTAVAPPAGVDLLEEIGAKGLVLESSVGEDAAPALRRLAASRAREREVALDAAAVDRLLERTDADPALFSAELGRLLDGAGKGGRVRAADVEASVVDESSEDVYDFFDAIGRRDAGDALARLERLLEIDRRGGLAGQLRRWRSFRKSGFSNSSGSSRAEIRRMLLLRALLDEAGGFDAGMSPRAFETRLYPRLVAPVAPFGRSAWGRAPKPYALFKASQRAARYSTAGARARPVPRRRRGREHQVLGAASRDALALGRGAHCGAVKTGGERSPGPMRGTAPQSRSPPCLGWKVVCLT